MLKNMNLILLSIVTLTSIQAKDYEVDKNGNINVNIIDRKVIVNGKVVRTIPKGEPIKATVGNTSASIHKDRLNANVDKDIGARIDGDNMSANVGGIGVKIENDNISIDIGSVLESAIKIRNRKDTKEEKDFFESDSFFDN